MNRKGSILWILFLLAAMFLGPTVILKRSVSADKAQPDLRTMIEQEKLIDAPASLREPAAVPYLPDAE